MTKLNQQFWEEQARKITDTSHLFKFKSKILDKKVIRKDHILKSVLDKTNSDVTFSIWFSKLDNYKGKYGIDYADSSLGNKLTHVYNTKEKKIEDVRSILSKHGVNKNANNVLKHILSETYEKITEIPKYFNVEYYMPFVCIMEGESATLKIRMLRHEAENKFSREDLIKFVCPTGVEIDFPDIRFKQDDFIENEYYIRSQDLERLEETRINIKVNVSFAERNKHIRVFKVKDDGLQLVGKIELFRNKQIDLDIRLIAVVKNYEEIGDATERAAKQEEDYQEIVNLLRGNFRYFNPEQEFTLKEFFNTRAFNQAAIQCNFEEVDDQLRVLKLPVSTADMEEKIKLKDNVIPADQDAVKYFRSMYDDTSMSTLGLDDFTEQKDKKGIFLFIAPFEHEEFGGQGKMYPVENQNLVLFRSNWNDIATYIHEIGHVIGLTHSFWKEKEVAQIDWANRRINSTKQRITNVQKDLDELLEIKKQRNLTPKEANDELSFRNELDELTKNLLAYRKYLATLERCKYRFRQSSTDNYMDYSNSTFSFFYWQWSIMREEVERYHS